VDEKGNVVYSQTPPMDGAKARKLDSSPAYRGSGGDSSSASPYDSPSRYSRDEQLQQSRNATQERQQREEEARRNRQASLEAECNRNRGTDCKNPETLRYLESTRIPRSSRR
jgi:hypothetical protein